MIVREARCCCGALTARASGDPARVSVCHCLECKRRTGAAFAWNATWPEERIETAGAFGSFTRSSDEGYWVTQNFCPTCATMVFYRIERRPGMITIPVGAFADPDFPAPTVEVFEERRCPWLPRLAEVQE
jgi:hypothetical protein